MLSMYGTYLVVEHSTVQYMYVSYPTNILRNDMEGGASQSHRKEIRSEAFKYERFQAIYDERSYDLMENGGRETKLESNGTINYQPYYDNVITEERENGGNDKQNRLQHQAVQWTQNPNVDRKMKTILWYDTHQQSMVGHSTKVNFSYCEYKLCQFKYIITAKDIKPIESFNADAILVQSKAIFTLSPPPRRDPDQVFVLAVRDAFPIARTVITNSIAQHWTDIINWTMTYRLDSDIVYKYASIVDRQSVASMTVKDQLVERKFNVDIINKDYDRIFDNKSNDAVWFVSHCKTKSHREEYVSELQKVINVNIYGFCGETAPCPKGDASCFQELALKYKFYLAFENTFYADYVTEKVYHWFDKDVIVVARGGSNYSRILPPGTIIDAGDFESPIELGKYLKELANDKDRYTAYLKRKDNYLRTSKLAPIQEANCKLCEYLHTLNSHRKSYSNIFDWWLQNWRNWK